MPVWDAREQFALPIDPNEPPDSDKNKAIAERYGYRYKEGLGYIDAEARLCFDLFGQPY